MKLNEIGEFGLIEKLSKGCLKRSGNIITGIGDDAAAFITEPETLTLITTDLLVERVHFQIDATDGFSLGYKSLAVNLSDIAAMGGIPREAFISIAIPEDCRIEYIENLYAGIKTLGAKFDVNILGGDTTGSKADLIINIAVTGQVLKDEMLLRSGAKPGDKIAITGFPGESRAGLHMMLNNIKPDSASMKALVKAHIKPEPQILEGQFLAKQAGVHACIDVSDGLTSDLYHIIKKSRTGAKLFANNIPISKELQLFCERFDFNPVKLALSGGEDYFLLLAVSKENYYRIAKDFQIKFKSTLFQIGEITDSNGISLLGPYKEEKKITPSGWDHFNKGE